MQTIWQEDGRQKRMTAPISLIISAFAPVTDVNLTMTPVLKKQAGVLILIDLGEGRNRLGGSVLAQTYNQLGDHCPDLDNPLLFRQFFDLIQQLNRQGQILAYHDRSDGGLLAVLAEMLFGIGILPRATQNLAEWERLQPNFTCYFPDETDAKHAAELQISLRRGGWQLETVDAFIAVTALRYKLTLLTTDKDFMAVPGLLRENWKTQMSS